MIFYTARIAVLKGNFEMVSRPAVAFLFDMGHMEVSFCNLYWNPNRKREVYLFSVCPCVYRPSKSFWSASLPSRNGTKSTTCATGSWCGPIHSSRTGWRPTAMQTYSVKRASGLRYYRPLWTCLLFRVLHFSSPTNYWTFQEFTTSTLQLQLVMQQHNYIIQLTK